MVSYLRWNKGEARVFLKRSFACRKHMDGREGDKAKNLTWKNTKILFLKIPKKGPCI